MKKLVLAAALVVMSFGTQAQEMHEENSVVLKVCTHDSDEARTACRGMMMGFKAGFLYASMKAVYLKHESKSDSKAAIRVALPFREKLEEKMRQIDSDEMILEYAKVLKNSKQYQVLPSDFALGQALTNLLDEMN